MHTSQQVRQLRAQFRESKQHIHLPPASLVADNQNKTVLFNVAGMQPLVPYLSGKQHPLGRRLYNIQPCIRTNDIEDIGDERHLSMFEMMGNRSLGDYFKTESLTWTVEFLVEVLGIDKSRLGATIFGGDETNSIPRDEESYKILQSLGIAHIKEMYFDEHGDSDNFWTPGPVGPCGPCCEFYYDRGEEDKQYQDPITGDNMDPDRDMGINDRYTEIWNNVFMSYYNTDGVYTPLPQKNVDTGMGFERLMMVLQSTQTIFETDIFAELIKVISKHTNTQYNDYRRSYRIILDHARASIMLLTQGVIPTNESRGYILRRLIRRMIYHIHRITQQEHMMLMMEDLVSLIVVQPDRHYSILHLLDKEITQFQQTIKNGQKILDEKIQSIKTGATLDGLTIFKLYDTHGFPVELTQEIAHAHGIQCDLLGYYQQLEKAKTLSRDNQNFKKDIDWSNYISGIPATQFVYDSTHMSDSHILKDFLVGNQRIIILDKTPAYAESGGQVGDHGDIILDDGSKLQIQDVKKFEGVFLHFVK